MAGNKLRHFFKQSVRAGLLPQGWAGADYDCYRATEAALAGSLYAWCRNDAKARAIIAPFIRENFHEASFRVDEQGRLSEVFHNNKFLPLPQGWFYRPMTLWAEPVTKETKAQVSQLPPLPTRRSLHVQIGWAGAPLVYKTEKERTEIDRYNDLVQVKVLNGAVYVLVPQRQWLEKNFPERRNLYSCWRKPAGLELFSYEDMAALDRVHRDLATGKIWPPVKPR
jgi:hypothetical protein